jgi:hypothetical protein
MRRAGLLTLFFFALLPTAASAVSARRIATGFDHPVFAAAPAGDARLFVVEQTGRIRIVEVATGAVRATPFLDLSSRFFIGDFNDDERGLLGLASPRTTPPADASTCSTRRRAPSRFRATSS